MIKKALFTFREKKPINLKTHITHLKTNIKQ